MFFLIPDVLRVPKNYSDRLFFEVKIRNMEYTKNYCLWWDRLRKHRGNSQTFLLAFSLDT